MMVHQLSEGRISVIHSSKQWLTQTMTWLYTQVKNLPEHIENCIVCEEGLNLDQFALQNIYMTRCKNFLFDWVMDNSWRVSEWYRGRVIDSCVRRFDARILHSHFGNYGYADLENAHRNHLRHVVSFYGYDASLLPALNPVWPERFAEMFDNVDMVLCEGPHLGRTLTGLGCPESKLQVQHLGIDVRKIRYKPREWKKGDKLRFLIAGSFVEKKGFTYAIDALGRVSDEIELELTVIGDDNGTQRMIEEKQRILQAVDKNKLSHKTRFLGRVPYNTLLDEAYRHHIFLHPSVVASDGDSEGGAPLSIIEMLASGMPVVTTSHCDIPNVVPASYQHLLSSERNVDELETVIRWFVDNPESWAPLLNDARKYIETDFNARIQGQRLGEVYESIL